MKNTKKLAQILASAAAAAMLMSAIPLTVSAEPCAEGTHTYKEATCTEPETCTVCGETKGEALGHTFKEATCTEPKTCSVCGATEGEALGHKFEGGSCTEPKKCAVCGITDGEPAGHSFTAASCTEPRKCSVCGLTDGEPFGHIYSASWTWSADNNAYLTLTCKRENCNEKYGPVNARVSYSIYNDRREYTAEITVNGVTYTDNKSTLTDTHIHNYVWKETAAATTYSTGTRTQVCTICGKYGSSETIPMKSSYYSYSYYPSSSYWYPYNYYYYSPYYYYYGYKTNYYPYRYYYYYPSSYYYYGWRMPAVYKRTETVKIAEPKDIDLKAVCSGSDISLSWNKIKGAENYTVYVSKNGGEYIELGTTRALGLRYTGLTNNNTYKFIVKYTKNGKLCEEIYDGRASAKVYYKPAVVIKSDKKSLHLSWGKVKGAEKYAVYKIVNGHAKFVNETRCSAVKMTGLAPKTEYSYVVRAYVDGEWTPMMKSDIVTARTK